MGLPMAAEVDGVGVYVDVHEVVDNFTLDVILHPVDEETAPNIDDLDEGQVPVGQSKKKRLKQSESLKCDTGIGQDILCFWCHLHTDISTKHTPEH